MKESLTLLLICVSLNCLKSQDKGNPNFDLDIRLGYTIPSEANTNPGLTFGVEPRYWLGSRLSIGIKIDNHNFGSELVDGSPNDSQSFVLTSDIYSSNKKADRLYSGLGIGLFRDGGFSGVFGSGGSKTHEGISLRLGYLRNQVRVGFEYNLIFNDDSFNYYGFYFSWSPF